MLSPQTIAASLIRFHEEQTEDIEAFWVESSTSRQELVSELDALVEGLPILVATVAKGRFADPDGVVDDLNVTILDNEEWFTPTRRELIVRDEKFSIVLVSKRPLGVPQLSSPVELPDWFPLWPSRLLTTNIKSVYASITLSLASQDIPEAAINDAMFELEKALGARLESVIQSSATAIDQLQAAIANHKDAPTSVVGLVASSKEALKSRTGAEFRPGGSVGSDFIVSHLARLWRDCPPKDRQSLATSAAEALGLNGATSVALHFSLMSLLARGKESLTDTPAGVTFCRNLMGIVSDAVQFINARHHADEFPEFAAVLTISFATELAISCRKSAQTISELA
jgi:hypothetical protein